MILGFLHTPTHRVMVDPLDNITPELAHALAAFGHDDLGNAERLAYLYGDRIMWVPGIGWHHFDGCRWAPDSLAEVPRLAARMVRALLMVAGMLDGDDARDRMAKHAIRSAKGRSIAIALDKLRDEQEVKRVGVLADALDAAPHLLNVANGTVDLRTGELKPHDPRDLITKLAPVAYDPNATAPLWDAFQRAIANGDDELVAFKQRAFGYTATGETGEQVFFIAHGAGSNGKTTELELVAEVLGDYAVATFFATFASHPRSAVHRFGMAGLAGARFVRATEGDAGARLAEGTVKAATGSKAIAAEFKGRDVFTFRPRFTLWLGTNHRPETRGTDHGLWRRVRLVPYPVRFEDATEANPTPAHPIDRELPSKLRDELPGILAWIVVGARAWYTHGLGHVRAVTDATDEYRADKDVLGDFVRDCIDTSDPDARESAKRVHDAHVGHAREQRRPTLDLAGLKAAMNERGLRAKRLNTGQVWLGVKLTPDGDTFADAANAATTGPYDR